MILSIWGKNTNTADASPTSNNLTSKLQNNRCLKSVENEKEKKPVPLGAVPQREEGEIVPLLCEVPHPAQEVMGKGE